MANAQSKTKTTASESKNSPARFPDNLPRGWKAALQNEKEAPYFLKLSGFLKTELQTGKKVFPSRNNMLRALQKIDLPAVKVVILGQDPYHGEGQAIGLSFAVPNELQPKPPSLQNIFKEMEKDLNWKWDRKVSDLSGWANQGVLLLNTLLSVRSAQPLSHANRGWEIFTDKIIQTLNARQEPLIFFLWGGNAQKKKELITAPQHKILTAPHPSPLSVHRGFYGSKHFSKANEILKSWGQDSIDWTRVCE